MGKKVTSYDELPDWFTKTDYLAADEFAHVDWYFQLGSRKLIVDANFDLSDRDEWADYWQTEDGGPVSTEELDELESWLRDRRGRQLEILRKYPVSAPGPTVPFSQLGPAFSDSKFDANGELEPISRITLQSLYHALGTLPKSIRNDLMEAVDSETFYFPQETEQSAYFASWAELPVIDLIGGLRRRYPYIWEISKLARVDLSIPDERLIESFKTFLATCRSEVEKETLGLNENVKLRVQKWIDYGVLPYLDLQIWAVENDRSVTSSFAAKALADHSAIRDPDYRFGAYTIDTTVKKYVREALSIQSINSFKVLASSEIESREKDISAKSSKISDGENL